LGEGLALIGIVMVLIGMVSTARLFRDEYVGPVPSVVKGFVPITSAGLAGSAPLLPERPHSSLNATVRGLPRAQSTLAPAAQPAPSTAVASTQTSPPQTAASQPSAQPAPDSAAPAAAAQPTREPILPSVPDWIDIPVIGLEAPLVPVQAEDVRISGQSLQQWSAPNSFAGGWHATSALLGLPGNTVINGHHNIFGSVFARLRDLQVGDQIIVWGEKRVFFYEVDQILLLEERYAGLENRQENARWILPSDDQRLTLVTCWPPESNTHRLIVVARHLLNE
jgi:sortase A